MEENKEAHETLFRLLSVIDSVCRENSICYYIGAGTLLGAVREGGFIPWDDDCDVLVFRRDFGRLCRALRESESGEYFLQDEHSEDGYPFAFAKLRSAGCEVREAGEVWRKIRGGYYVDIFPLDRCPRSEGRAVRFFRLSELFTSLILSKDGAECGYEKHSARLAFSLLRHLPRRMLSVMRRLVRIYYSRTSARGRLATVYGAHGYPRESYLEEWFRCSTLMPFESGRFPAPVGYHALLKNMYGDYMTPRATERGHLTEGENEKNYNLRLV